MGKIFSVSMVMAGSLLVHFVPVAHSQGFLNLGFESSPLYLGADPGGQGSIFSIPNWMVNLDGNPQNGVLANNYILDDTAAALFIGSFPGAIDGNQSVFLEASSYEAPAGGFASASISQTGRIPATATSIEFTVGEIWGFGGNTDLNQPQNNFYLSVNRQFVPLKVISNNGSIFELAGDVSPWAGQTAQLSIGVSVPYNNIPPQEILYSGVVDSVVFSPSAVPEPPATVMLMLSSMGILLMHRRRTSARLFCPLIDKRSS